MVMVEAQVKFAIVGHPKRASMAYNLTKTLAGVLFMDTPGEGAYANHRRALAWAARQGERVTIVEDDALPVTGVDALTDEWAARHPDDLLSFYLGTGHPTQWMRQVDARWGDHDEYVQLPKLIHGVAYSVPPGHVQGVLDRMGPGPIDYAVGDAWRALTGGNVIYPKASLFDHRDGDSLASTGTRRTRRTARLLHT